MRQSFAAVKAVLPACGATLAAFSWESHGYHVKATTRVLKTARDVTGVWAELDGERRCCARSKFAILARLWLKQIVQPHQEVMELQFVGSR